MRHFSFSHITHVTVSVPEQSPINRTEQQLSDDIDDGRSALSLSLGSGVGSKLSSRPVSTPWSFEKCIHKGDQISISAKGTTHPS